MKGFDAIVAGAGIWGCTVARRLAEAGKKVLVLEKRAGVGGNCRCEIDPETGIEIHTYGSHIFHTSNEEVWAFVRRFTEFNGYRHCVLARTRVCGREGVGDRCRCTVDGVRSSVDAFVSNASDGIEHSSSDAIGTIASTVDRRRCAEKKVEEWLAGVDETTFEAALVRLVEEKTAAGEYRFKKSGERELALEGARKFYREFARKIVPLSDGRYVYFAPDERAKTRNANNAISWAEYAFHAVSSSGKLLDGKNFRERLYNQTKAADLPFLESIVREEHCMYRLIDAYPENDAVIFVGRDGDGGRLEVITRLDQFGNAEANLGEVTVIAKHKRKEFPPPKFRPLTEVVETVAKHQAAGFSPSTTIDSIANSADACKGGRGESKSGAEVEGRTGREGVGDRCRCTVDGVRSPVDAFVSNASDGIKHSSADAIGTIASTGEANRALPGSNHQSSTSTSYFDSLHTYHLPIGKTLLEEFFGVSMKERNLKEFLKEKVGRESRSTVDGANLPSNADVSAASPVDAVYRPRRKEDENVLRGRGEDAASTVDAVYRPRRKEDENVLRGRGEDAASTGGRGEDAASTGASRTHGDEIFDAFIRGYTSKQWGVAPEKVDPSIIARLKVRDNYSTDYFDDPHQGIPSEGYNRMFERMLDHPNITVQCGCELYLDDGEVKVRGEGEQWINPLLPNPTIQQSNNQTIYYSGPIDALFNYKYGALPWRTLRFERETLNCSDYQGNSVVNYTDAEVPYTRIHEFKHYHPEWGEKKVGPAFADATAGRQESRSIAEGAAPRGCNSPNCTSGGISPKCPDGIDNSTSAHFGEMRPRENGHPPTPTLHSNSRSKTVIMREYSATWQPGDEPYYPIDNADSRALLARYQAEVEKINSRSSDLESGRIHLPARDGDVASTGASRLIVGGRLGSYKYFDMDKSIAAALEVEIGK